MSAALPDPSGAVAQEPGSDVVSAYLRELHLLVNRHRESVGCVALAWDDGASRVAEAHSEDMYRRDFFDHLAPEGTDLSRRLLEGGVTWHGSIAENIALTVRGPGTVIELWVDSPPHRENLEDCAFTHHGLGLFHDRWTQVLIERPDG